jgi:hypothetical protein
MEFRRIPSDHLKTIKHSSWGKIASILDQRLSYSNERFRRVRARDKSAREPNPIKALANKIFGFIGLLRLGSSIDNRAYLDGSPKPAACCCHPAGRRRSALLERLATADLIARSGATVFNAVAMAPA